MDMKTIKLKDFDISNDLPFVLIAGPCALESAEHAVFIATELDKITKEVGVSFIFKTSFDKANRTSIHSKRGAGIAVAAEAFTEIRRKVGCPILTDIHEDIQCYSIMPYVDILQIPAFLCRQTDLLTAAARTQKVINVKKGQFLSPYDMVNVVEKIEHSNNERILLTDRGVSFGYNTLVSDMRALPIMASTGYPVVFDATHSVQQPGGQGTTSGGQREFVPTLARAAVAVGVAGIFMEVHDNPDDAWSDGPNMIKLSELKPILVKLKEIDNIIKNKE